MEAAITRFIRTLRRAGVRISPAESVDALQALVCVRLADRETTRDVLRSTLIKSGRDEPLFETLFALFFGPAKAGEDAAAAAAEAADGERPAAQRIVLDTDDDGIVLPGDGTAPSSADTLRLKPGSLEEVARNLLVERAKAMLDPVMQRASQSINLRSASPATRPGTLTGDDTTACLDADLLLAVLDVLLEDLADGADELPPHAAAASLSALDRLPEALRLALEQQLAQRQSDDDSARQRPRPATPQRFSEAERREMEVLVRRLGRRMRGDRSYRRVIARQGRIHVARTLRASMAFDGVPFRPVVTRRRIDNPRLVVICDVSQSVRSTARFTLHLVYSLQALFERVRSFVFVSDLAEASVLFERLGIDEAIDAVFAGGLIDCEANSNYGRAFEIFTRRHLATVTSQTTVIVLGDGRGNRNPPNVAGLEDIRRRAQQLIWLSPEPRGSWGIGGSDMPLYAPVCHRAEVVRNLAQLGEVADGLFRRAGAGGGHG